MADLAELTLRIKTQEVAAAKVALDGLTKAAGATSESSRELGRRFGSLSKSAQNIRDTFSELNKVSGAVNTHLNTLTGILTRLEKAANGASAALDNITGNTRELVVQQQALGAAATHAAAQMNKIKTATAQAGTVAKETHAQFFSLGKLLLVGAGAREAIKTFGEFEQTMAQVRGITIDMGAALETQGKQFNQLKAAAFEAARETKFSSVESAEALLNLGRAGFSASEAVTALPAVLRLALNDTISLSDATSIAADTLRQFGKNAEDLSSVVNVLATVANRTNSDIRGIGEALSYVGPAAKSVGRTLEETAAAIGILANSGIKASNAGTALRGIFVALLNPAANNGAKAAQTLEIIRQRAGASADAFDLTKHSFEELLEVFNKAQVSAKELELIFNRQVSAIIALKDNVPALRELQVQLDLDKEAAERLANITNNTLLASFSKLRNAFQVSLQVQNESGVTLKKWVDTATVAVRILGGIESSSDGANRQAQALAASIRALVELFVLMKAVDIITFFARLLAGAKSLGDVLLRLGTLISANPWVALAGAIAAASVAIYNYAKAAREAAEAQAALFASQGKLQVANDPRPIFETLETEIQKFRERGAKGLLAGALERRANVVDELATQIKTSFDKGRGDRVAVDLLRAAGVGKEALEAAARDNGRAVIEAFVKSIPANRDDIGLRLGALFNLDRDALSRAETRAKGPVVNGTSLLGGRQLSRFAPELETLGQSQLAAAKAAVGLKDTASFEELTNKLLPLLKDRTVEARDALVLLEQAFKDANEAAKGARSDAEAAGFKPLRAVSEEVAAARALVEEAKREGAAKQAALIASSELKRVRIEAAEAARKEGDEIRRAADKAKLSVEDVIELETTLSLLREERIKQAERQFASEKLRKTGDVVRDVLAQAAAVRAENEELRAQVETRSKNNDAVAAAKTLYEAEARLRATGIPLLTLFVEGLRKELDLRTKLRATLKEQAEEERKKEEAANKAAREEEKRVEAQKRAAEQLDDLNKAVEFRLRTLGMEETAVRALAAEEKYLELARAAGRENAEAEAEAHAMLVLWLEQEEEKYRDAEKAAKKYGKTAEEILLHVLSRENLREIGDELGDAIGGALDSAILKTNSLRESLYNMANELERVLLQRFFTQPLGDVLGSFIGDGFGSFFGSTSARGNVFSRGNVVPFARGGVVGGPTTFPMSNGRTGLMGEAGPEAIMPLAKGPDGMLGVRARGGGNTVDNRRISVHISLPNVRSADGFRRARRQIADDIANGIR